MGDTARFYIIKRYEKRKKLRARATLRANSDIM
jgi:hypothetical protein